MGQEYNKKKKCIYNTTMKNITTYGSEVWRIKKNKSGNGLLAQISKNM
jgi:hypothetical protein